MFGEDREQPEPVSVFYGEFSKGRLPEEYLFAETLMPGNMLLRGSRNH